jgi:hypothetical protein
MRDRLQTEAQRHEAKVQGVLAAHQGETTQLKATINMLRAELEAARNDTAQSLASQIAASARDQDALQNQIKELRLMLETRS